MTRSTLGPWRPARRRDTAGLSGRPHAHAHALAADNHAHRLAGAWRWGLPVLAAGLLAALGASPARAALSLGATSADQGRRIVVAQPVEAPASAPALNLARAVLDAVDLAGGAVTVAGQRLPLHPDALRVLGPSGQALGPRALQAGQQVRLALEPAGPLVRERRVLLVYIDAQR